LVIDCCFYDIDILKGSGKRPDILISEPNVSPVIVETEIMPATSVGADATQRLGEQLIPSGRRVLFSLAVRLPARLRDYSGQSLKHEIATASDFEMAFYTGENPEAYTRWPQRGWVRGNTIDLSILIQSVSAPPTVIEEAANKLVSGVNEAACLLSKCYSSRVGWRNQDILLTNSMERAMHCNVLLIQQKCTGICRISPQVCLDLAGFSEGLSPSGQLAVT
jgi:hypothetical protein